RRGSRASAGGSWALLPGQLAPDGRLEAGVGLLEGGGGLVVLQVGRLDRTQAVDQRREVEVAGHIGAARRGEGLLGLREVRAGEQLALGGGGLEGGEPPLHRGRGAVQGAPPPGVPGGASGPRERSSFRRAAARSRSRRVVTRRVAMRVRSTSARSTSGCPPVPTA